VGFGYGLVVAVAIDTVADLYGWNWAAELERQTFLRHLSSAAHPHFRWRVEPPPAPSELPLESLGEYTKALSQEFQLFEYRAGSFAPSREAVLVTGSLVAVTVLSGEPFARPFQHRWRLRRGVLVDVRLVTRPRGDWEQLNLLGGGEKRSRQTD
jgi:hypothetical protein